MRISICVPTLNRRTYLQRLLPRLVPLVSSDLEVLIVGDNTDLAPRYPTLAFYAEPPCGLAAAFNRCVDYARGDFILIFHDDDLIEPELIPAYQSVLRKYPQVGIIFSYPTLINELDEVIGTAPRFPADQYWEAPTLVPRLVQENVICCPSAMVNRRCYETLGRFRPDLHHSTDWELWLRIAQWYPIYYVNQPLLRYRLHHSNVTDTVSADQKARETALIQSLYAI